MGTSTYLADGDVFFDREGNRVSIFFDQACRSPRELDNLGTFYTWSRCYASPDSEGGRGTAPDLEGLCERFGLDFWELSERGPIIAQFCLAFEEACLGVALPVSAADHGDVTYRVGDPRQFVGAWPFDAAWAGVIFAEQERVDRAAGRLDSAEARREWAAGVLEAEVEVWDKWQRGECYGYTVEDPDGVVVDSARGFIGETLEESGIADELGELFDNPPEPEQAERR